MKLTKEKKIIDSNQISRTDINSYLNTFRQLAEDVYDYSDLSQILWNFYNKYYYCNASIIKHYLRNFIKNISFDLNKIELYFHVPFCFQRCSYCHNPSDIPKHPKIFEFYLQNVIDQVNYFSRVFKNIKFHKLSIGGGTPNILSASQIHTLLSTIFKHFNFQDNAVKEIEFNPYLVNYRKISILKRLDMNRISFGVQSLDKNALINANRPYITYDLVKKSIILAKRAGFENINVDLILGFKEEQYCNFEKNLMKICELQPLRIEIYVLRPPGQNYLERFFYGNKSLFYERRNQQVKMFINKASKKIKKFGYCIGDPGGINKDYFTDPLSINSNYFVLIKNGPHYHRYNEEQFVPFSCFGIGKYSCSNIFANIAFVQEDFFTTKKPIFKVTKLDMNYEMKRYIFRVIGEYSRIPIQQFHDIFNVDIFKKFKSALYILCKMKKVKIKKDCIYFLSQDKKEIFIYSMFFLLDS